MTRILYLLLAVLGLSGCGNGSSPADSAPPPSQSVISEQESSQSQDNSSSQEEPMLKITVGDQELLATFADNSSAEAFRDLLAQGPVTVSMDDYGGFEKVGSLGTTLTRNDTRITTQPGDVILYQGNQITIYYGTNTWNFTRLAVARQFFCETRTEFLRKNSPVLRSKSETRSLASTAPKMEGAVHVKGRVLAWGGAAFAAPPLAFCPWGSSYPSVASPASSAASWAATGSVYSDQP